MNLFGMMLNPCDLWLLGIVGGLATILINYRLANTRGRIARLATASAKFNYDVLNILSGLYPLASNWPNGTNELDALLRSFFPKMQIAVEEFKHYLPWYKRILFKRAWSRFRNAYGRKNDIQCYHHYLPFGSNPNYKENFKHNVDSLLEYAKKT